MRKHILRYILALGFVTNGFSDELTREEVIIWREKKAQSINERKTRLGTAWDAVAIMDICRENIKNNNSVQEYVNILQSVSIGIGFAKGVVRVEQAVFDDRQRKIMTDALEELGKVVGNSPHSFARQQHRHGELCQETNGKKLFLGHLQKLDKHMNMGKENSKASVSAASAASFIFKTIDSDQTNTSFLSNVTNSIINLHNSRDDLEDHLKVKVTTPTGSTNEPRIAEVEGQRHQYTNCIPQTDEYQSVSQGYSRDDIRARKVPVQNGSNLATQESDGQGHSQYHPDPNNPPPGFGDQKTWERITKARITRARMTTASGQSITSIAPHNNEILKMFKEDQWTRIEEAAAKKNRKR